MRPYLAVIRDSFHEALASRVLWVVAGLITLFLLALMPLGLHEEAGWYLDRGDFLNRDALVAQLVAGGGDSRPSPARRVWTLLESELKSLLADLPMTPEGESLRWQAARQLRHALNELLARRDFYEAEAWKGVKLLGEARGLEQRGLASLPPDQLARFNRLALQAGFPDQIAPIRNKQVRLTYFGWEPSTPIPLSRPQLNLAVNGLLLAFMVYLLGTGGVLVGILVTAGMIPHTFEPGTVDLLLSKPISRVLLLLTKFVGGMTFMAINATYCIVGLWLVVGWRIELWNQKLILCIPLYLFLFSIYYAVSTLVGLVWRNAVMSVVLTIAFWGICALAGSIKAVAEAWVLDPQRIIAIVPAGDVLLAANEKGDVLRWEPRDGNWEPTFRDPLSQYGPFQTPPLLGPVFDITGDRLLAGQLGARFGPISGASTLVIGRRSDNWRRTSGVLMPDRTAAMHVDAKGQVLAASARGIFRLRGDGQASRPNVSIFGVPLPLPEPGGSFVDMGPKLSLRWPASAAFHRPSGAVALYDSQELWVLEPTASGRYRERGHTPVAGDLPGIVAMGNGVVLLALADGRVQVYDAATLALGESFEPEPTSAPRFAASSPDGRWLAILFHNRKLVLMDTTDRRLVPAPVSGQGDISGVAFGAGSRMWVADRLTRVVECSLPDGKTVRSVDPPIDVMERLYYTLLRPLYAVFPKPGQLDQTMTYLMTDQDTAALLRPAEELSARRTKLDVWGPVWSNLGFLACVLALASVYVYRKDF